VNKFINTIVVSLLFSSPIVFANTVEKMNKIFSPVRVSQNIVVSPRHLCHDGLYLYFKNEEDCKDAAVSGINCTDKSSIVPLRSTEDVYPTEYSDEFITRFYHIDLNYLYQEVIPNTSLVLFSEMRKIPYCENRERQQTKNIRSARVAQGENERIFVQSIIDQAEANQNEEFLIINTPVGNMPSFELLGYTDPYITVEQQYENAIVKTPFCSDFAKDMIWQMSGEYTGSGNRDLKPASLQTVSRPLYLAGKKLVENDKGDLELRYTFTCEKVWSI